MSGLKRKLKKWLKKGGKIASWGAVVLFPLGAVQLLQGDYFLGAIAIAVAALSLPRASLPFVLKVATVSEKLLAWILTIGLLIGAAIAIAWGDAVRATSLISLCILTSPVTPLPRGFGGEWLSKPENRLLATAAVGIAVFFLISA